MAEEPPEPSAENMDPVPEEEIPLSEAPSNVAEVTSPDAGESLLQPCTNCATLLDVGDLEPFAKVHCPICGTAMRARTQLKNFTLVEVLGTGGMGAVYKALDTHLNRMVALKVVRKEYSSDAEYVAKFEREARITASVNHPHVVKVYSFGSDHGLYYIAMELVDKGSLDDLMNLQGRVAEIQALGVGIQVAQGLQAAHQKGLIHRDVKPGNILFADSKTAKIVDFGLALLAEHEAEERGEVWGTPYYVAPEKLDHAPEDFRSDMYSLGGTLFHAISGRPPFEADTASMVALKHLKSKAVSLQAFAPDVTSATAYVINRTLNKDPDQRYQSYAELIEHLEYARGQLAAGENSPRKPRQRVVVEGAGQEKAAGIMTLLLILILIGAGFGIYKNRDKIFSLTNASAPATAVNDPQAVARQLQGQLDAARKQLVAWDYAGALDSLKKLDDSTDLTQPLQNWVTIHEGLVSLLQNNPKDAEDWFKVVHDRAHYSNDLADSTIVNFFSKVGGALAANAPIDASEGGKYASDSVEAFAPFLFAMKDWSMGRFTDAGKLLNQYLNSTTPREPFQWVGDYKQMAQTFSDDEAAYEKVLSAIHSADTPEKRADALKQAQELHSRVKGPLADALQKLADDFQRKSAALDEAYNQQLAAGKQRDEQTLTEAKIKYASLCADFRFDEARAALDAASVTTADAIQTKQALLKKAGWLLQFKAQLIQDINSRGYPYALINRGGAALPDGPKKAADTGLIIQTQFGPVPCPWNSIPPKGLLAMANQIAQSMAATAPQQATDRLWLAGVFAFEEGMVKEGRRLLVQASQTKSEYTDNLVLFPDSD